MTNLNNYFKMGRFTLGEIDEMRLKEGDKLEIFYKSSFNEPNSLIGYFQKMEEHYNNSIVLSTRSRKLVNDDFRINIKDILEIKFLCYK
jgi:hypothetical protein